MNNLQELPSQRKRIFPIPRSILLQTIQEYAGFDEDELLLIKDSNLYAANPRDPARWLLELHTRPELEDAPRQRLAYRTGVDFGATAVRKTIALNGGDSTGHEFLLNRRPRSWPKASRYLLSQYFESGEDVRLLIQGTVERHWLDSYVSFVDEDALNGSIDDPFVYGCGDALALYAFAHREAVGDGRSAQLQRLQAPPAS